MNRHNEREVGPDLIRCIAVLSVLSVHFFLNINFYDASITGTKMYVLVSMRTFFMICVPLFIMLTGYFMSQKQIQITDRNYYIHLLNILGMYVLVTIFIILFQRFYQHISISVHSVILNVLGFQQYAWYVNMYIGLYLLTPLLNIIWSKMETQKETRVLILLLMFLTTLPSFVNIYDFNTAGWWKAPWTSTEYNRLVPDWWENIYPVTYYFIGAYIHRNQNAIMKLKKRYLFAVLLLCVLIFGSFNYFRSYSVKYIDGPWCSWGGFENVIDTVLVFLLILLIPQKNYGKLSKIVIKKIAQLSFGTYLASWIMDQIVYSKILIKIPIVQDRLFVFVPCVLIVFIGANLISWFAKIVFDVLKRIIHKLFKDGLSNAI